MKGIIALTGMTGFIGSHIADALLAHGFALRALSRQQHNRQRNNVTWVQGALDDASTLAELVKGAHSVVHCAGQVRGHNAEVFTDCNVSGSLRLMQAATAAGGCQRFLFISSLAARHPELSWYAHSKYLAEQRLIRMAQGISLGIFRPTAVYGPGDKELKPLFNGLLRGVLPRLGSADARLSFLHVSDLAAAVVQWLISQPQPVWPYELCDGTAAGYSWQQLQQIGAAVRQRPVRLIPVSVPLLRLLAGASTLLSHLSAKEPMLTRSKINELTHPDWSASNTALYNAIGWRPETGLEYALREGLF